MRRRILLGGAGQASGNHGTGTANDPFLIYTPEDLLLVESFLTPTDQDGTAVYPTGDYYGVAINERFVGQYLKVVNDLDLSAVCGASIGNYPAGHSFGGDFDGDGHTISYLYSVTTNTTAPTAYSTANKGGLFYSLSSNCGARVHHVVFENFNIRAYYGGFIGACWGSATIDHIVLRNGSFYNNFRGGGILGYASHSDVLVEDCVCEDSVTFNVGPQNYCDCGAIVGWLRGGKVKRCINLADIEGNRYHIGGIVGGSIANSGSYDTLVSGCINFGKIRSTATLSGCIAGNIDKGALRYNLNCGWLNSVKECSGILGYKSQQTCYVDGNLNIGMIDPYSSTSRVGPISSYGSTTQRYNYHTPEVSVVAQDVAGQIVSISQSDLVCQTDDTRPSSITDTTYWNTANWVFKAGFYPYPKDVENTDACLCAAVPVVFASGDTFKAISGDVELGGVAGYEEGITWSSSDDSIMRIDIVTSNGESRYVGKKLGTGSVTITNWKNGKAYKRITLTLV